MTIRRLWLAAVLILPLWGCTCGDGGDRVAREKVAADDAKKGQSLEPLPDAPALSIPPEAFGAAGELTVVVARPVGPTAGDVRPSVTFSRPIKSLADIDTQHAADAQKPVATITPAVDGAWRWLGSASAEFVPTRPLPYSTEFEVTVHKGLRAIDGTTLDEDYVFRFSTPKPELQDISPARGNAWLRPEQPLKLVFNQPVRNLPKHVTLNVEGEAQPRRVRIARTVSVAEERRKAAAEAGERHHEPMDEESRGFTNNQTRYELVPEKPLPLNKAVTLVISEALRGEQGPLRLGEKKELPFRTYGPLTITGAEMCGADYGCPHGPLVLFTSNELDLETLKDRLYVTPKVELDWERATTFAPREGGAGPRRGPRVSIPGEFRPGTEYSVEVSAGTKDVFGQRTKKPFTAPVATDDLEPALYTGGQNALVEAAHGPRLPIEVVNIRDLEVDIWNITASEAAKYLSAPNSDSSRPLPRMPDYSEAQTLTYPWNERALHKIDLSRVLGGMQTGLVLVQVNSPNLRYRPKYGYRVLAQITNLATHLKLGPASSAVWVTELSTGKPVRDAVVSIYGARGKVRASGVTDAQGLADLPGAVEMGLGAEYDWQTPFAMAVASRDLDVGLASGEWSEGLSAWDFNLTQGWEGAQPTSTGFLFTDRGIYRPGDTVHLKGLARYLSVGKLLVPEEGSELTVLLRDPRGDEVRTQNVQVTKYGTFNLDAPIGKDAALGWYSVEVAGTTPTGPLAFHTSFRVAEYRPPQFKVDVTPNDEALVAGEPLSATVHARYLFGGAMPNARVRWSVHRASDTFMPKGLQDYTFAQETWWWDDNLPGASTGFFGSGTAIVGADGTVKVIAGSVEAPGDRTWSYTFEAEVEDVSRQTVANRAAVTVHPSSRYVGLRVPGGFGGVNRDLTIDTVVTDTSGARVAGAQVMVEILHRTWKSVKQKDAGGGYVTISEPAEEKAHQCALQSAAEAPASCTFQPTASGFYIVRATVTDERQRRHTASTGVYVTGAGFAAWQQNDTERIDLVPEKTRYEVGDTAKVLVKSPYPEARALITVEREGVLQRKVVTLTGSVNTVDVQITEDMVPNVYMSAVLVRPRVNQGGIEPGEDPGRPAVRVGLTRLDVEKGPKRLAVEVKPERTAYRPGEEVNVALSVRDAKGQGVPAEVTFFVVDEAVLRLTGYKTPDPLEAIYPVRPLSVRTGEPLIHLVRRRSYGEKGEEAGGGGANPEEGGGGFRSNFKTTVVFRPNVETSADGNARVSFKLPDNLTTFRLMAVAATAHDRFGSGESSIEVTKPLLALPALPRFARVGDSFEAGVVVHARGDAQGEVVVTAGVQGARLSGPAEQKVIVAPGSPQEVRFAFLAEAPGTAAFRFRVQRGGDTDGVEVKIPIEVPVGLEAVATYGDTTDKRVEGISPPKDARADTGGLEVTLASTALGNFQEGFRQLVEYPYGCLEQQSSRLVPFVALRELAPKFGLLWSGPGKAQVNEERELNAFLRRYLFDPLDVTDETNPDEVVRQTIRAITSLQAEDGSFRYWPESECADSWSSAYATLALHRAKEVGYEVPTNVLMRAQRYLKQVAGGTCSRCERDCSDETRVMAAHVLARTGRPQASTYGPLYERREKLPLFARALLADALFVGGGDREKAKALLQEILNHARESPRGVHFEEVDAKTHAALWHSDARTTGAVLQTLATISPDHPYVSKIAHYLTAARTGGRWRTTQEAAYSLMGLTELVRTKEKQSPDFIARVMLGDDAVAQEDFRARTTAVKSTLVPMATLQEKAKGKGKQLQFVKEGPGVLYYSALLRYAPKQVPTTPLERGLYVQRWFEPYAGGGQARTFYAGDLVRVRVRVSTNQERHFAVIEVPLPAGLEPVDTSLATSATQPRVPDEESGEVGYDYESAEQLSEAVPWAFRFWSPFTRVEQRDSKVVIFADHLPPGIHVTSFVARATTPGSFVLQPARGELMYEPEVFGRSDGGRFEILVRKEVSQR